MQEIKINHYHVLPNPDSDFPRWVLPKLEKYDIDLKGIEVNILGNFDTFIIDFNKKIQQYGYKVHHKVSAFGEIAVRFEKISEVVASKSYYVKIIRKYLQDIENAKSSVKKSFKTVSMFYLIYFDDVLLFMNSPLFAKEVSLKLKEVSENIHVDEIIFEHGTSDVFKHIKKYIQGFF